MTSDTALMAASTASSTVPRGRLRQLGVDAGYNLLRFPLGIASFVIVVTGLSAGGGLVVVWVGIPVLALTLVAARGFATIERALIPGVLRGPVPEPAYLRPEGSAVGRMFRPIRDPQTWLDALHGLLSLVTGIFGFVITVTFASAGLGGLTYVLWGWALPDPSTDPNNQDLLELMGFRSTLGSRTAFYTALGLLFVIILPFAVRGAALLSAQMGRVLLTSRAATQARMEQLSEGRDAAVAAEAVALRRLERDIHDGPQQRLVRLQMDLSRAQRQLARDPDAAATTLGEAAGLARETLEELRALSRGIAPPVLADRGLAAALAAIAARSPVPVELAVDLPKGRLAPATENTAYFVVSEALANIAKHSRATTCRVEVGCTDDRVRVTVDDDGVGGAVLAAGHGLSGLADRLFAVDGVLTVDSPRGGPTRLTAELPCA